MAQSTHSPRFRALIERDEVRQLRELREFSQRHKRIFVLVHGYNTSVTDADLPFSIIEEQLDLKPGDGVIRFYWDGLIGKGAGAIKIWFKAASDSQLVGSRAPALRCPKFPSVKYMSSRTVGEGISCHERARQSCVRIRISRKNQSRSQLGQVIPLNSGPKPLVDQENNIHVLLLAPAIDRIDFCDSAQQPRNSKGFVRSKLRPLGTQVKSFGYTVNPDDPVLGKFIFSSHAFNPTGLGYTPSIGRELKGENV